MSKKSTLDRIKIPNPCFADWERMDGTQQVRYCTECNKYVYNLSGMTRGEAEALIASAPRGRLCARLTREADGTTVTTDTPPGIQLIWRRASPIANGVVSAMLAMATPGVVSAGYLEAPPAGITAMIDRPDADPKLEGFGVLLSGTIMDRQDAMIAGAEITLIDEDTGDSQRMASERNGEFRFFVLRDSVYTLKIKAAGFENVESRGVHLSADTHVEAKLTPARNIMGGAMGSYLMPLREIYNSSDRIVVARVGRLVQVDEQGLSRLIRVSLMVSQTLKGEGGEPIVNIYRWVSGETGVGIETGGTVLAFLRRARTDEALTELAGYELVDFSKGLRDLSNADLNVYIQRIEELRSITRNEQVDQEALVEWLVRCAEDPATRWEGASDLASSAASLRASWTQDDSGEDPDSPEADEEETEQSSEVVDAQDSTPEPQELGGRAAFAALLTADQKERLMKALLAAEEITEGDEALIELEADFHEPRLLPFLVSQLHRIESNPPATAYRIVQVVAELLNDRQINALSENYRDATDDDEQQDQDSGKATSAAARKRSALMRNFLGQVERKMRK